MKLECTFCKRKDPEMIPFRWAEDIKVEHKIFCSAKCLLAHRSMSEMSQRPGLKACLFHKIMVVCRCLHRLIIHYRR